VTKMAIFAFWTLQTRIEGEKRRLSDMKIVDSPMKSINIPSAGYSKFVLPEKR
jgi:hypothetical protein